MGYLQKRIQEFVQGTDFEFFSYYGGGAQHSSGPENSLKPGYFTNPGGGGWTLIAPSPWIRLWLFV